MAQRKYEYHNWLSIIKGDEIMKIAISSSGENLNSQLDPRFGRCTYFLVIDPDEMTFEVFSNENDR